jgi:hypothetical protein
MHSQWHRQVVFTLGMLVCGCLEAAVAGAWVGLKGVEGAAFSLMLCLVPGWLTIYASGLLRHPDLAPYVVLVGTGVRMLFVLLGLFLVSSIRPDLGFREFTVWLIVGYLVSLALETWMVLLPSLADAVE